MDCAKRKEAVGWFDVGLTLQTLSSRRSGGVGRLAGRVRAHPAAKPRWRAARDFNPGICRRPEPSKSPDRGAGKVGRPSAAAFAYAPLELFRVRERRRGSWD